jgi:hypothetical protein
MIYGYGYALVWTREKKERRRIILGERIIGGGSYGYLAS